MERCRLDAAPSAKEAERGGAIGPALSAREECENEDEKPPPVVAGIAEVVALLFKLKLLGTASLAENDADSGLGRFGLAPNAPAGDRPKKPAAEGEPAGTLEGGPKGSRIGEEDKRWGCGDCIEEERAERIGTGAAEAMADVLVLGLLPSPASMEPEEGSSLAFSARDSS